MQRLSAHLRRQPPRGATRTGQPPRTRLGVWLFMLVAGLATVTIASIPEQDQALPSYSPGMPLTPPEQIINSVGLNGDLEQRVIAASAVALVQNSEDLAITTLRHDPNSDDNWTRVRIRRGDSLLKIMYDQGLAEADIEAVTRSDPKAFYRLLPRKTLGVRRNKSGQLQELRYQVDQNRTLSLMREDNNEFVLNKAERELQTRLAYVTGRIRSSLFADGQEAGLSDAHIIRLAEIFGWDIDFALDVQPGDSFSVIHEEKYWMGQKVSDGPIIAAQFVNRGSVYRAIGYRDKTDQLMYFTPKGESMRRAFLRSPVKFSRISSRFTKRRYHPILKRWRAHRGIDYAAPTGKPVRSTATGRIIHRSRKGGYGNTVIIRHGSSYSTLYAHLSRYQRGLRVGSLVQQGQIIGYVGKSGLATGPHLHYEFRVHDKHRNPLAYKFPKAQPIDTEYRQDFLRLAQDWTKKLLVIGRSDTLVAKKD